VELLQCAVQLLEQIASGQPEGLDPSAAADFIGVHVSKLHDLNSRGLMPAPANLGDGRCPRFVRSELLAWLIAGAPSRLRWQSMRELAMRRAG
jgi:hypothetical protein